jgi:hypothetical protein
MQLVKLNTKECEMKRLIPVLAVALILILTSWDSADARRYPPVRIDEIQYDHPWGGEQNNPNPPMTLSGSSTYKEKTTIISRLKTWNYKYLFGGLLLLFENSQETTTEIVTPAIPAETQINNAIPTQGGIGQ